MPSTFAAIGHRPCNALKKPEKSPKQELSGGSEQPRCRLHFIATGPEDRSHRMQPGSAVALSSLCPDLLDRLLRPVSAPAGMPELNGFEENECVVLVGAAPACGGSRRWSVR